jgi:hypothetical protein
MDINGLAPGHYWLQAVVDPNNRLIEADETNNVGRVLITIGFGEPTAPAGMHGVQLASGETAADRDFGNFQSISISGHVFNDRDANRQLDSNDKPLEGWVVFMDLNEDGVLNNSVEGDNVASALADEPWAITDKKGDYVLTGVGPGSYLIRQIVQAGWSQTTPNPEVIPQPIDARSGQNVCGVNFGNVQIAGALMATGIASDSTETLTGEQVLPLLTEAIVRWQAAGADFSSLSGVEIVITDLPGATLGLASNRTIWLDINAAGSGWFVDATPWDDSEFTRPGDQGEQNRMDLLTVLAYEIGHLLGLDHDADGLMAQRLSAGTRLAVSRGSNADPSQFAADLFFALLTAAEETAWSGSRLFGRARPKR